MNKLNAKLELIVNEVGLTTFGTMKNNTYKTCELVANRLKVHTTTVYRWSQFRPIPKQYTKHVEALYEELFKEETK